jgi:O-antigen ligase
MNSATQSRLARALSFVVLAGLLTYFTFGLSFNGILLPATLQVSAIVLTIVWLGWLGWHIRRAGLWYRTPLDGLFVLWGLSIVATIAVQHLVLGETTIWRRSIEAVFYLILYMLIWFLLTDLLANGALERQTIISALLFAGLIVMIFAYLQVWVAFQRGFPDGIPRPVSVIGNSNALSTYLMILLPFALMRALQARQLLVRMTLSGYAIALVIMLGLARSRGALLAMVAAVGVFVLLYLLERGLLAPADLRRWFKAQSRTIKITLMSVLGVATAGIGALGYYLYASLALSGRSLTMRTYLWEAALEMYQQSPLIGVGLYTYGRHLPRYDSIPPGQPQAHAHSLPLNILAELGTLGLLVALVSVLVLGVQWVKNWRTLAQQATITTRLSGDMAIMIAGSAALTGYGVHHLLDTPAMMPLIAVLGIILLALVIFPFAPREMKNPLRRIGHPIGMAVFALVLMSATAWQVRVYDQYYATLSGYLDDGQAFTAAEALDAVIAADPQQRAYILQQAYLYGLAASTGDDVALRRAIAGYERYTTLEPTHAQGWSNLAALYYQAGDRIQARMAIDTAIQYAPDWSPFKRQRNIYANALRDAPDQAPTEAPPNRDGANWSRFQYLRDVLDDEYLPQVGWGNR